MPTAGSTHDFVLTSGSTSLGLMLARKRKKRVFRLSDALQVSPRVLNEGEMTLAEFGGRYVNFIMEENWQAGIGGLWHRTNPSRLADSVMIEGHAEGILRPARHTYSTTVDSNPTEYVPSGFAAGGGQEWAFIGRELYQWDFTNANWDQKATPVAATRIFRNMTAQVDGVQFVPSWADDVGSGGSYVETDMPVNYIHKTPSAASWTLVSGANSTNLDSFKYFAVANDKLWGANCVHWADSTLDVEGGVRIEAVTASGAQGNVSSVSYAVNAGTGSSRLLVVNVLISDGTPSEPSGITYNGVALTSVRSTSAGGGTKRSSVWRLIAPASGSNTLVVTLAGTETSVEVVAYSLSNVHQTTPITDSNDTNGLGGTTASIALNATADNELGLDFLIVASGSSSHTIGAGQTSRYSNDPSWFGRSSVEEATGASVTLSWTWTTASEYASVALTVQPVASVSATQTYLPVTGTPSSQFVAGDVIRIDASYKLVTAVTDADFASAGHAYLTVVQGYRGTVGATHTYGTGIYEATSNPHHVHSTTNGTALASWASATAIGDSSSEITGVVGVGTNLYVFKTDGVYKVNSADTVSVVRDMRSQAHDDNFRGATAWNQYIFMPMHSGGLWVLDTSDSDAISDISFSVKMPDLTALHGPIVALASAPDVLYALVLDSTNTKYHVLRMEQVTINGTTDFRWHHVTSISYTTGTDQYHANLLLVAVTSGSTTHHRLLVGVESTGSSLLPYTIAHDGHDAQPGYTNSSSSVAQFEKVDMNLPDEQKTWAGIDVESRNLGAGGRQWALEFRVDNGSWLTTLTDASGNADGIVDTSPSQTMTFPNGTTGKILEVRAKPALTTVGTTAAEIRRIRIAAQTRPARRALLPVTFYLAANQRLLNGALGGSPTVDLSQLETWDNQAAELTVVDPRGTSRQMQILHGTFEVVPVAEERLRRPEYYVSMVLASV